MDAIIKQLLTPEWWFTVIVAGLVVGVVAAYAKEYLSSALATISRRFRAFSEVQTELREKTIERMMAAPHLLLIEYARTGIRLFVSTFFLLGSFLLPAWQELLTVYPNLDPTVSILGIPPPNQTLNQYAALFLMVVGLFLWTGATFRFRFCEIVRKRMMVAGAP